MTRLVATMLFAATVAFSAAPASAAEQCAAHGDMIKALGEQFHENAAALGVVNPNVILEIFVSEKAHGLSLPPTQQVKAV